MIMLDNARKIHLIEEVLKLEDKNVLKELESVLQKSKFKRKNSSAKQKFLKELKESVQEVSLAKRGKIKLQSAKEFLNGL
jgi:hypothetical protein